MGSPPKRVLQCAQVYNVGRGENGGRHSGEIAVCRIVRDVVCDIEAL